MVKSCDAPVAPEADYVDFMDLFQGEKEGQRSTAPEFKFASEDSDSAHPKSQQREILVIRRTGACQTSHGQFQRVEPQARRGFNDLA